MTMILSQKFLPVTPLTLCLTSLGTLTLSLNVMRKKFKFLHYILTNYKYMFNPSLGVGSGNDSRAPLHLEDRGQRSETEATLDRISCKSVI